MYIYLYALLYNIINMNFWTLKQDASQKEKVKFKSFIHNSFKLFKNMIL